MQSWTLTKAAQVGAQELKSRQSDANTLSQLPVSASSCETLLLGEGVSLLESMNRTQITIQKFAIVTKRDSYPAAGAPTPTAWFGRITWR